MLCFRRYGKKQARGSRFFEKKAAQKTFDSSGPPVLEPPWSKLTKVFLLLFLQKKKVLLF
jgi:hypothetical protein